MMIYELSKCMKIVSHEFMIHDQNHGHFNCIYEIMYSYYAKLIDCKIKFMFKTYLFIINYYHDDLMNIFENT